MSPIEQKNLSEPEGSSMHRKSMRDLSYKKNFKFYGQVFCYKWRKRVRRFALSAARCANEQQSGRHVRAVYSISTCLRLRESVIHGVPRPGKSRMNRAFVVIRLCSLP